MFHALAAAPTSKTEDRASEMIGLICLESICIVWILFNGFRAFTFAGLPFGGGRGRKMVEAASLGAFANFYIFWEGGDDVELGLRETSDDFALHSAY